MITAFCSICCKDEVAALLREQELYWRVEGVASEQEMVAKLTTINPPAPPITLTNDDDDRTNVSVGCFVGGAGICMHYNTTCIYISL